MHFCEYLPSIVTMTTIPKSKTRMLLTLPRHIADALEAEAAANCARPSQIARSLIAKALRERPPARQRDEGAKE